MLDAIAGGEVEQPDVWPDPHSVTVWTGVDWFTVTVMPVRARTEQEARGRALLLAQGILRAGAKTPTGVTRLG